MILITTNAMHVFRTVFPHIYVRTKEKQSTKQENTKEVQRKTLHGNEEQSIENEVNLKLREYTHSDSRNQITKESKETPRQKASPPSARNQNKNKLH